MAAGYHSIEFRFQEYTGGDVYKMYWQPPSDGSLTIIPSAAYSHCAGLADINLTTQVNVISDPINITTNPKAIPEAIINISVTVTNQGNISTDLNSTVIVQTIDSGSDLYVADFNGPGPINFVNDTNVSGVIYQYLSLNDNTDDISFSSDGVNFNHAATADSDGYDGDITHIKLELESTFKPTLDTVTPSFSFEYQTKIK